MYLQNRYVDAMNILTKYVHFYRNFQHMNNFDPKSSIQTAFCRYGHSKHNSVVKAETEELHIKLYPLFKIENLLEENGFFLDKKLVSYTEK